MRPEPFAPDRDATPDQGYSYPMSRPLIVALSGKRCTGKDTLADAIEALAGERGVPLRRCAFASECKRAFADEQAARGASVDLEKMARDRGYKEEIRPALTAFTERALAADPLVFFHRVMVGVGPGPGLLTDLRLRLELDALRPRARLLSVRVERPLQLREASGFRPDPAADGHFTETDLDEEKGWDLRLINDGSIEAWRGQAAAVVDRLQRELGSTRSAT